MLTLKIIYRDSTQWVGGIRSVTEMESAEYGPDAVDPIPCFERLHAVGLTTAHPTLGEGDELEPRDYPLARAWGGTIHVGTYNPESFVKAVLVEYENGREDTYICPTGATFLLGQDGKTLDRM